MITIDTRERKFGHIKSYFDRNRVPYEIRKLDFGDYYNEDAPQVVIDRKQHLIEVTNNLCSPDSSRFWREIRGAHRLGIKVVILVEHGDQIKSIKDVAGYQNPYSKVTGSRLQEEMFKTSLAYGVEWKFCNKSQTGRKILEILGYGKR